jgi:hypothetical protein
MSVLQHGLDDIEDLIEDLAVEKRRRSFWVGLFMAVTVLMFLVVVAYVALMILTLSAVADTTHGDWFNTTDHMMPFLGMIPLFGVAMASLSGWKAQADCQQSLDLAINAARKCAETGRGGILARRLKLIECAGKDKRRMWQELAGVVLG